VKDLEGGDPALLERQRGIPPRGLGVSASRRCGTNAAFSSPASLRGLVESFLPYAIGESMSAAAKTTPRLK